MENIHDTGKGSISSSFPPPVFSAFPSFTSSKCHQEPKSFIIYRLTSQSPAGEVWGWEMGRERESKSMISECTLCHSLPHVILMGKRGTSPACLSVSVCVNMLIRNFLPYLAWGFYSCHTLCFWGGAGLVPKHSISCSSVSSLTAGSEAPTCVLPLWSASSKLHQLGTTHSVLQTVRSACILQVSSQTDFSENNLWPSLWECKLSPRYS